MENKTKTIVDQQKSNSNVDDNAQHGKTKKKHISALVAASKARSVISHVNKHSYRDIDFSHTGTNLSYHDEDGTL